LIEGGTVTTALVGQIAVAKYGRHFDFYRQMQIATASNSNRHSPDEIWNGVDDSRRRGSPEGTDQLRSAPGVSVATGDHQCPSWSGRAKEAAIVKDRFSIAAHVKPPGYIVSSFYVPESYG
jgi:hypothetical protein